MFVTLREDVPTLGKKNERVQVSDAYARNVLVPKKLAFVGIQSELRIVNSVKTLEVDTAQIKKLLLQPIVFVGKVNDDGGLYKKINEKDIITRLVHITGLNQTVFSFDKSFEVITNAGEYSRPVRIKGKTYNLLINIDAS